MKPEARMLGLRRNRALTSGNGTLGTCCRTLRFSVYRGRLEVADRSLKRSFSRACREL